MLLSGQRLCGIVIALLLGGLWHNQAQANEPGNASPAIAPQPPSLNEKDLFPYKQKGRGTLAGQAFLGSLSGKAVTQAGAPVHLIPITPYTRYWFDHTIKATTCSVTESPASAEGQPYATLSGSLRTRSADSAPGGKAVGSLSPHNQNEPHRPFLVYQIPAGRYYIVSLIEEDKKRNKDDQFAGLAWLSLDLEAGEKASNLVATDCESSLC